MDRGTVYLPVPLDSVEVLELLLLELFSCFFDLVPASPPPPYPVSEPIDPLVPMLEPLPLVAEPVPLVLGVPEVLVPLVPPLVEPPVCAKAAPPASIEITAIRFHHLFIRSLP